MQDDATHEPLTELIPQPRKMTRIPRTGRGTGLHLDADDSTTAEIDDEINLLTA